MQKKEEDLDFLFKKISVKLNKSPDDFEPFNKMYFFHHLVYEQIGMIPRTLSLASLTRTTKK